MSDQKIVDIEEISDYSIDLMHEISKDIAMLPKLTWKKFENDLADIDKKIDYARKKWLKVDVLDKQLLDFRVIIFKRDIKLKLEQLDEKWNNYTVDITKIRKEYDFLKQEKGIILEELHELMDKLEQEVTRSKIKHMITCIYESWGTSVYSIENVTHELQEAKEKWIRVDDIEEMIFW